MKKEHPGVPGGGALRAKEAMEWIMKTVFLVCGFIAIAFVLLITVYLIISGLPAIREVGLTDFLFGTRWASTDKTDPAYGILPFILTSIYGTAGAILIGVPIGFLMAVFLSKVAPKRVANVVRPVVDLLAGIPSIVYGLVGLMVLVPFIRETFHTAAGESLLAAIVVLAIMILPSIISVSETALKAVPPEYEEASLALGATHERSVFTIMLPAAKSGVLSAVILGVGRAIGETMAVIMVAGNQPRMPKGILEGVRTLTTNIVMEMGYASGMHRDALIATAAVLFVFILIINFSFSMMKRRSEK